MKIKVTVDISYNDRLYVKYYDLPDNWDSYNDDQKQDLMNEYADDYMNEIVVSYGELVELSEMDDQEPPLRKRGGFRVSEARIKKWAKNEYHKNHGRK